MLAAQAPKFEVVVCTNDVDEATASVCDPCQMFWYLKHIERNVRLATTQALKWTYKLNNTYTSQHIHFVWLEVTCKDFTKAKTCQNLGVGTCTK